MITRKLDDFDTEMLSVLALLGSMITTLMPDPMTEAQLELAIDIRDHLAKLLAIGTIMIENEKQEKTDGPTID